MNALIAAAAALFLFTLSPLHAGETPSPAGATVYFIDLSDGDTVSSPVTIRFGLAGMGVAPAGVDKANTGHHHLLVDRKPMGEGPDGAEEFDYAMPADEHLIHFGGGQTETVLDLPPGDHTLQLVLGDHNHIPHDPPVMSPVITVTVE